MDDCEHSVILDYFSRKYFNMKDNVEVVDTLSGKTIRVDNDRYIRIQDLILKLDMLFIEDPYKCRILMDILDIDYIYLSIFSMKNIYTKRDKPYKTYIAFDENTLLYKIGRSSNPFKRIKGSSTFSPFVKLMFVSDRDVESAIHNKYSKCRKLGEWFDLPEKDLCDIVNNYDFVKYEGR